jgi:glycosyltransferase involved in cell wall biosynthesis
MSFQSQSSIFLPQRDTRVSVQMKEDDYENLWKEGDIYLHLHRWDGLSLPINEAMAAGMPIIAPNFYPHNEFLPKRLLFPIEATVRECLLEGLREIDVHDYLDECAASANEFSEYESMAFRWPL